MQDYSPVSDTLIEKELEKRGYNFDKNKREVTDKKNQEQYFLKCGKRLKTEKLVLEKLRSEKVQNVSELVQAWETDGITFLILGHIDGQNLKQYLDFEEEAKTDVNESFLADLLTKTVKILSDLQTKGVHYLDLKLENVMICNDDIILIDFEFVSDTNISQSNAGTNAYFSPEKLMVVDKYDIEKSNTWALGVMMYMLFEKSYPFPSGSDHTEVDAESRMAGKYKPLTRKATKEFSDLLSRLLQSDPNKRLDYSAIEKHSFVQKYFVKKKIHD